MAVLTESEINDFFVFTTFLADASLLTPTREVETVPGHSSQDSQSITT